MRIAVPVEIDADEPRVAATAETVGKQRNAWLYDWTEPRPLAG